MELFLNIASSPTNCLLSTQNNNEIIKIGSLNLTIIYVHFLKSFFIQMYTYTIGTNYYYYYYKCSSS